MFTVALLNAMGTKGREDRPKEKVLMLAFGESGTTERGRIRLMRSRRGEMSGHDIARESGLGEQGDHWLREMPLLVWPIQPLIEAKRTRGGPGPSHSTNSPTAAPPPKKVRMSEMESQTSETIETLDKNKKDWHESRAKLEEYNAMARERDEWKKKYNPYGKDFNTDRIGLSDMMDSLVGLDEVMVRQEIDLVNDTEQDWIDDCSEPKVEFKPETELMHEQELTNLRVLEWLHDLPADPEETILTIRVVGQNSIEYISHDKTESKWVLPDGLLHVPEPIQPLSHRFWVIDRDVDGFFCPGSWGRFHPHRKSDDQNIKNARETGEL